jgi:nucleoid DNA-binding protein
VIRKSDIVEEISRTLDLTPETVSKVITLYGVNIVSACMRGEKVVLRGFGTFEMVTHRGRTVRNHGKEYHVPERMVIKLRPGKLLYADKEKIEACKGKCRVIVPQVE